MHQHQSGAVLIVTMVMLVAIMMIGLDMANDSWTAQRMLRNIRDKMNARQSAELALTDAEAQIEKSDAPATPTNALPCCTVEIITDHIPDNSMDPTGTLTLHRITAIARGPTTQVVLQSMYRRRLPHTVAETKPVVTNFGRLSWREISNWPESR